MAGYRRQNADGPNSEEKALDLFAEMMIEKIESINKDWRKPWFTEGALQWPRNLSGREYNGNERLHVDAALRERGVQDTPLLYLRLRAADEQAGQGRTGTAEGLRAARREILPGDAYHFHLHTQGDEGENQV